MSKTDKTKYCPAPLLPWEKGSGDEVLMIPTINERFNEL